MGRSATPHGYFYITRGPHDEAHIFLEQTVQKVEKAHISQFLSGFPNFFEVGQFTGPTGLTGKMRK